VLENPVVQVVLVVLENPAVLVVLVVLEDQVARVVLAVLEKPVVRVVGVALALENPVVPAVLVREVLAALPRRVAAALLRQAGAPAKAAETRSVAISRRQAVVAAAPSLAAVGTLLKLPAIEVAVV